ncbi:MAG: Ig-like domain-containing protein, partial [Bacteroidota bacterium]
FWPDGQRMDRGWAFSQADTPQNPFGTATGEYMGHFLKHYFGTGGTAGQPRPKLVEVINEPMYHLVDINPVNQPIDIFRYHNSVAQQIKRISPEVQVGGWCTAFPDLEKNNFQQWEQRWKLFMDTSGSHMDFWTMHLYDWPVFDGKQLYRKGSNLEATFDMMEHYSQLKFGRVKDFMVSEYGAQTHEYIGRWSPYRDWLHMKSVNSMMMQFMERSPLMNQTTNFLIIKATWGTIGVDDTYTHRLLRRANEPDFYSGTWVYTENVKVYQLWNKVEGRRVDTWSSDLDVLTDAFVKDNKAFVILNNLDFEDQTIQLTVAETHGQLPDQLLVRRLYLGDSHPQVDQNAPIYDTLTYEANVPNELILKPEATYVLEYTYPSSLVVDQVSQEVKHYAETYYQSIEAATPDTFQIKGVDKQAFGEATLRIGLGREHGKSLRPQVWVNDSLVGVPYDFRGDDQRQRETYFGVVEVNVPYDLLQVDNEVRLSFDDDGGFVSSLALQSYAFTQPISRSRVDTLAALNIYPDSATLQLNSGFQLEERFLPFDAALPRVEWMSLDSSIATVGPTGLVTTHALGSTQVIVKTPDGAYADTAFIKVENVPPSISVDDPNKYISTQYFSGEELEVIVNYSAGTGHTVTEVLNGVQVMLREVTPNWLAVNDYVASDPSAIGQQSGQARVTIDLTDVPPSADLPNGNFYFLFPRFNSSSGQSLAYNGLNPITILAGTSDVAEVDATQQVKVYPNPAQDRLLIESEYPYAQAVFYNLSGQVVHRASVKDGEIILRPLVEGMYFLELSDEVQRTVVRVTIQR